MEDFKADILTSNKKGKLFFYSSVAVVLFGVAMLIVFQVIPIVLQLFSIIAWLFFVARYFLQSKKQVLKKATGTLQLSTNYIRIDNVSYNLSEISLIKIFISGYKSYQRSHDRNLPVSNMHNGDKNLLTILVNDQQIKCEFQLTSKEHTALLHEHVINWYRQKIKIIEDSEAGKTHGLRVLNYKEIQEFKKQIQP